MRRKSVIFDAIFAENRNMYLYNHPHWPIFEWNSEQLLPLISYVRNKQGKLLGKMSALGFELQNEAEQSSNN